MPLLAEVLARLGSVSEDRVLLHPTPGTATVCDLLDRAVVGDWPTELVDGTLVRKVCGWRKGALSARVVWAVMEFADPRELGVAAGAKGPIQLRPGLIRAPDVSFIRWDSVEDTDVIENPAGAFLEVPPDLAVEVLSPGNSVGEMAIKLDEYAKAGVKLVWYIDPERKEVDVYPKANPKRKKTLTAANALTGGDVLPGFAVPVARLFESRAPKKGARKGKK